MKKILFDESHAELLNSQSAEADPEIDNWKILRGLLEAQGWEIGVLRDGGPLTDGNLKECDLLVLGAPGQPLLPGEIKAIQKFIMQGHGLLVANSTESLWRQNSNSMKVLLEPYGICFERSLYSSPKEVVDFHPHYISSGISRLSVSEPTYLEPLTSQVPIVAMLSNPQKPFLLATDGLPGRIVAIGDFVVFGDHYIKEHDNCDLALNIFKWLLFENTLDCREVQMESKVLFGKTVTFSIVLINQLSQRAERIRCLACFRHRTNNLTSAH